MFFPIIIGGFLFAMLMLFLGLIGVIFTLFFKILAGILWVGIKLLERRVKETEEQPEIIINIVDDPPPMRDVTPLVRRIK
jgi:positive regulator of sigma E activity